jgi:hypothetical protein
MKGLTFGSSFYRVFTMTTRKNFVAMAEIISQLTKRSDKLMAAKAAIKMLRKDNPRFDKKRFMVACGLA